MPDPEGKLVTPVGFDADGYPRAGNLPFTYKDRLYEHYSAAGVAAGAHTFTGGNVPAGEVWVVTGFAILANAATVDHVVIRLVMNSDECRLLRETYGTAWAAESVQGWFVLKEGDNVVMYWTGCDGGEDVYGSYYGFKMGL